MRSDRLVAILLMLQRREQVTAGEVARELEVSERTARRDLDALAMSGIPVYSVQGRHGGWRLLGGARTDLSGLTSGEARALFLVAGPAATATPAVKSALRKLVRALPERSEVAVLQGAVEITARSGAARRLDAGQQAWFSTEDVGRPGPAQAGAGQWARGLLAVEDMRLADFAAELSRYRQGWLHCDRAVADLRITGAFQLGDTDAVLGNLVHLLPVQVHYRTRYWVTIAPRGGSGA